MSLQPNLQPATFEKVLRGAGTENFVVSRVPDRNLPGAEKPILDPTLKAPEGDGMVCSLNCQPSLAHLRRQSFRHGPRLEHTSDLEPEVVVLSPSEMLLNHKPHVPQNSRKWSHP